MQLDTQDILRTAPPHPAGPLKAAGAQRGAETGSERHSRDPGARSRDGPPTSHPP